MWLAEAIEIGSFQFLCVLVTWTLLAIKQLSLRVGDVHGVAGNQVVQGAVPWWPCRRQLLRAESWRVGYRVSSTGTHVIRLFIEKQCVLRGRLLHFWLLRTRCCIFGCCAYGVAFLFVTILVARSENEKARFLQGFEKIPTSNLAREPCHSLLLYLIVF